MQSMRILRFPTATRLALLASAFLCACTGNNGGTCGTPGGGFAGLFVDGAHAAVFGQVAIDAQGQVHVAYENDNFSSTMSEGRYGACGSDCEQAGNWGFVDLGLGGPLKLDTQGRPRLLTFAMGGQNALVYAECDANCASSSRWTSATLPGTARDNLVADVGFALTPQGGAAVVFMAPMSATGGLSYATCASGCTDPQNWTVSSLGVPWSDLSPHPAFQLAFDSQGVAKIAFHAAKGVLTYAECSDHCGTLSSWHTGTVATAVSDGPETQFSFALDPQGRPRIALHTGTQNETAYMWCDAADCTSAANWQTVPVGSEPSIALAMALDGQGNPQLAYYDLDASGVHYKSCSGSCDSQSSWTGALLLDSDMQAWDTLAADPQCTDSNVWTASATPNISMAIDPSGHPAIALDVVSLETCPAGIQSKGQAVFLRLPAASCNSPQ
jgi:hypothetical protein